MSEKTLIVMRHSKSSWKTNDPDPKRPLSGRGTRDAVVAGQILAPFRIGLTLCSSASRAEQTWKSACMGGARAASVKKLDALYHGGPDELLEQIHALDEDLTTVLILGHEPTLSQLIVDLVEPSALAEQVAVKFPTSAIAVLTFDGKWKKLKPGKATLKQLTVPRG